MPQAAVAPLAVTIAGADDVAAASLDARSFAREGGLSVEEQARVSTVVAELASNIVKYADRGRIVLRFRRVGSLVCLEVTARDSGDGIVSIDDAMRDHESTGGTLGLGLPGVRRLVDEFEIASEIGVGTTVVARRWVGPSR